MRLRAAAGRTIKRPYVANQSLQPTQLAGFNEQFDDLDGTRADWLGLAADVRASQAVKSRCRDDAAALDARVGPGDSDHKLDDQRDERAMAYLYWTPTDRIAASLELIAERWSAKKRDNPHQLRVRTWTVPLQLTYTTPAGWFATARPAFVVQDVDAFGASAEEIRLDSEGVLVDLAAGYRLPKRRGIIALEVTNLLDQHLAFQDESFRTSREEVNPASCRPALFSPRSP